MDEHLGDNCYNCPVVAYYPEVIAANCHELQNIRFLYDYVDIHRHKDFVKKIGAILARIWPDITRPEAVSYTHLTGALMSQTTFLQGESIPGIAHLLELSSGEEGQ